MNSKYDFHMHSSASDGSDSPEELLQHIISLGIKKFALTDHDTINGCVEMTSLLSSPAYNDEDVCFIKGIEMSCISDYGKCHILGFNYNTSNPDLLAAIDEVASLRRAKIDRRIARLASEHNIILSDAEVNYIHSLNSAGRPHLAAILVERGIVSDIQEAFTTYLKKYKDPYPNRIPTDKAIHAILSANGIPVWAHPLGGINEHISEEEFNAQLKHLISCGIKGLECYYSEYTDEQIQFLVKTAKENNLLISGGSDYHGKVKKVTLGTLGKETPYRDEAFLSENITLINNM